MNSRESEYDDLCIGDFENGFLDNVKLICAVILAVIACPFVWSYSKIVGLFRK